MVVERSSTLAAMVSGQLRTWLRGRELVPGELYSVQQVADRLGVSRSPVREALVAMADSGLVEFTRNRGFRVVVPTAHDVAEIFAVRLALEPQAARRAAARGGPPTSDAALRTLVEGMGEAVRQDDADTFAWLDQQLHAEILIAAGNRRAARVVGELRDLTRSLGPSTAGESRTLEDIFEEHVPILEAIADRDPARAQLTMRRHLVSTGRLLVAQCEAGGEVGAWESWDALVDEDQ